MIVSFLYRCVYTICFISYLPAIAYCSIVHKKYRKSFFRRLGWDFPQIEKKGHGPLIWVHAVSVGDTQAVSGLVKKIKETIHEPTIVISTITETGFATAQTIKEADFCVFFPFDFSFAVRKALRTAPDLVILSETDVWYQFLQQAKKKGAVIVTVNAKISKKSHERFKRFASFSKKLFSLIDAFCTQTEEMTERFSSLGVPSSKLFVTGSLKADVSVVHLSDEEKKALCKKLNILESDQVIVVGSSHDTEEEMLVLSLRSLLQQNPAIKLLLVPRHPERFSHVADFLKKQNITFHRFSNVEPSSPSAQIILVDAMGILRSCYQLATIAIVAGSFVKHVGGHNILEPAVYGVPVICGPYMHSQPLLLEQAKQFHAIALADRDTVCQTVSELLFDTQKYQTASQNARAMAHAAMGAVQKTLTVLHAHIYTS